MQFLRCEPQLPPHPWFSYLLLSSLFVFQAPSTWAVKNKVGLPSDESPKPVEKEPKAPSTWAVKNKVGLPSDESPKPVEKEPKAPSTWAVKNKVPEEAKPADAKGLWNKRRESKGDGEKEKAKDVEKDEETPKVADSGDEWLNKAKVLK